MSPSIVLSSERLAQRTKRTASNINSKNNNTGELADSRAHAKQEKEMNRPSAKSRTEASSGDRRTWGAGNKKEKRNKNKNNSRF